MVHRFGKKSAPGKCTWGVVFILDQLKPYCILLACTITDLRYFSKGKQVIALLSLLFKKDARQRFVSLVLYIYDNAYGIIVNI